MLFSREGRDAWWAGVCLLLVPGLIGWAAATSGLSAQAADGPAASPAAAAFPCVGIDGSSLSFDPAAPCHVIAFLGAGCPVARQYAGRLEEIAARYATRGVRVIGVDANRQDSAEEFSAAAREMGVTFPLVIDSRQQIARVLGATRTGGVVVLDALGTIAYAGRIDDQFAPGLTRPVATSHDLIAALDDILAGRPVATPRTDPVGCLITFDPAGTGAGAPESAPTFHRDVVPLLPSLV